MYVERFQEKFGILRINQMIDCLLLLSYTSITQEVMKTLFIAFCICKSRTTREETAENA